MIPSVGSAFSSSARSFTWSPIKLFRSASSSSGVMRHSSIAMRKYQQSLSLEPTGSISNETLKDVMNRFRLNQGDDLKVLFPKAVKTAQVTLPPQGIYQPLGAFDDSEERKITEFLRGSEAPSVSDEQHSK